MHTFIKGISAMLNKNRITLVIIYFADNLYTTSAFETEVIFKLHTFKIREEYWNQTK